MAHHRALPPLVVHLVYRFDTGGLENGIVNLINHMQPQAFRHAVVALTEVAPAFAQRIHCSGVQFASLRKPPGQAFQIYRPLLDLLRAWRPAVLHTRNLAALECQPAGAWAGVPVRIHGEHGRDSDDPHGLRRRQQWIRRLYAPFVHQHIALSRELADYLTQRVRLPAARVAQICNGVDTTRFAPMVGGRRPLEGCPFNDPNLLLVGTVGRMSTVKAQPLLARAFVQALQCAPELRSRLRLVLVGDGPLRAEAQGVLAAEGLTDLAWLPGERQDVPDVMRGLDSFVLPSLAEGISNTILEAMACGLPVLATRVGGNEDLVVEGQTGWLVPAGDVPALAQGLLDIAHDRARARAMGKAGRQRVEARFSLPAMVGSYQGLYQRLLDARRT